MATITLKGNEIHTSGTLANVGSKAPDFTAVKTDLSEISLADLSGKTVILNVFPSIDTGVCAESVRRFNKEATDLDGATVLCLSADLPFALKRFCGTEGIDNVEAASVFRSSFATDYGLKIVDGPLEGLCSRAVFVIDPSGEILYAEQVPEIAQEPNYEAALSTAKG